MSQVTIIDNPETDNPPASGRYGVVYRQGSVVRRFIGDFDSVEDRWLTGMPGVEILAWWELPEIPEPLIKKVRA